MDLEQISPLSSLIVSTPRRYESRVGSQAAAIESVLGSATRSTGLIGNKQTKKKATRVWKNLTIMLC